MASAIYILDQRLNLLLQRQYQSDLDVDDTLESFKRARSTHGETDKPLLSDKTNIFCQIKFDEVIVMAPLVGDQDCMEVLTLLNKFCELLRAYFTHYKMVHSKNPKLTVDLVRDNYVLIYELFDECIDFGIPQLTDFSILKEYIKPMVRPEEYYDHTHLSAEVDKMELQVEQDINSSVSRTAMTKVSWRPKGIFYNKNELFVDCNEYVTFKYNYKTNKVVVNKINGEFVCKSYLSGMPTVKLGLNETLAKEKSIFSNVQYHQCVDLSKVDSKVVEFIPCDGLFNLLSYQILNTRVLQPLIYVKPIYKIFERKGVYKLRIKVELVTTFKRKYTMSDVSIRIPLIVNHPALLINFNTNLKYKTKLGSVIHRLEDDALAWNIEKLQGTMSGEMLAEFDLITQRHLLDAHEQNAIHFKQERNDLYYFVLSEELSRLNGSNKFHQLLEAKKVDAPVILSVGFIMNGMTYSGVEINFVNVVESQLKFDSFNWKFHHVIAKQNDYTFVLSDDQFQNTLDETQEKELASHRMCSADSDHDSESSNTEEQNQPAMPLETNDATTALDNVKGHIRELKKKNKITKDDLDFEEYIVEGEETTQKEA